MYFKKRFKLNHQLNQTSVWTKTEKKSTKDTPAI